MAREKIGVEIKKQLHIAGPTIAVSFFQYSLTLISVIFVGHLGELPLAATALASSMANVTGYFVLVGISNALGTLCGESFGAHQDDLLGIHMQRGMLISLLASIPVSIIWINLSPILVALHQDMAMAKQVQAYTRCLIPSLPAYGLLQCIIKFLQTQNLVIPVMLATGISCLLHVLFSWLFIIKLGFGNKGIAIATCLSNCTSFIQLAFYVKLSSSCKTSWTGFSTQSFHNIPRFLRLAGTSTLMAGLQTWTYGIAMLLAGVLPNPKLEYSVLIIWLAFPLRPMHAIFYNFAPSLLIGTSIFPILSLDTIIMFSTIPLGVSAAASTRVSNEIGAGNPKGACLAVKVTCVMAMTMGIPELALLLSIRKIWGHAFTNVSEVISNVAPLMPILAGMTFLDAIQITLSGIARGCGRQRLGACINLGLYYFVGVPLAVVFAFVLHMKVKGLLWGIACAFPLQVVCLVLNTLRINWELQEVATERVQNTRNGNLSAV